MREKGRSSCFFAVFFRISTAKGSLHVLLLSFCLLYPSGWIRVTNKFKAKLKLPYAGAFHLDGDVRWAETLCAHLNVTGVP